MVFIRMVKMLILYFVSFLFAFNQPVDDKDSLIRDLLCLFIQKINVVHEDNVLGFTINHEGDNEIIEIESIPSIALKCQIENNNTPYYNESDCVSLDDQLMSVDGTSWKIVLTNGLFNPFLSYKYDGTDNGMDDIEMVFNRNGIDTIEDSWADTIIFTEVDTLPVFLDGDEAQTLQSIIAKHFQDTDLSLFQNVQYQIPFLANIIVDKRGKAIFQSLSRSTGITILDEKAIQASKEFARHRYSPAVHHGRIVSYSMTIAIMQKEWLPYIYKGLLLSND